MIRFHYGDRDFSEPIPEVAPEALWSPHQQSRSFDTTACNYTMRGLVHHLSLGPRESSDTAQVISEMQMQDFAEAMGNRALFRIVLHENYDALAPMRRSIMVEKIAERAFISVYNQQLDIPSNNQPAWFNYWKQQLIDGRDVDAGGVSYTNGANSMLK